jgi:hypothetical protein
MNKWINVFAALNGQGNQKAGTAPAETVRQVRRVRQGGLETVDHEPQGVVHSYERLWSNGT